MSYHFSGKNPKPRGASWPLGRSALDAALVETGAMDLVGIVYYWVGTRWRSEDPVVLTLRYRGAARGGFGAGRVDITVWAVLSTLRPEAEQRLLEDCVPDACRWIAEIPSRPPTWQSEDASRTYRLNPV